ncbi:MAG TPA: hypothetical protein PLP73_03075, partial [Candidatus Absconditabacterales bacterium]|nr:hypothetical protein [Candidatus Absconditabacterales bacterium]
RDVGQALVGKPIERAAKNTLKLFGFSDEELDGIDTEGDITQYLGQSGQTGGAKLIREGGKIAGTAALTAGLPIGGGIGIGAKVGGKELIKNVALRTLVEGGRGLAETATYNMASTGKAGDPINLGLGAGIAAAIGGPLSLLGSRVIAPGVTKLAEKLQLSGLLNRSRLDRLQTILKQGGSEDLAKGKAEDVANWMFQREIKGTKQQIINKLDDIANGSMELLDDALVNSTIKHNPEGLVDMLNVLKSEYEGGISATVKNKAGNIDILLNKLDTEGGLTLKEINEVKKMINKDLAPYTASGKIKLSKEDIAAANRQLKTYIEGAVEKEGLSEIGVKMLNNEYAMANAMKQAISEKLNTDMIGEILSFVSNRGGTSVGGAILGSQVGPFNNDSIEGKLGNIVFGFAAGRFLGSTQAKTFTAGLLKKLNSTQKAEILNYINKPKSVKLSDKTSKILLNELNKIDDSINLPNNIYDDVNNINVGRSVKSQSESIPQLKATVKAPEVDTSYRIGHQIDTKKSSPITSIDLKKIDTFVDEFKRQYGYPSLKSKELNKFKEIMKNPEADVKIYRASPKNELNQGDWVTIDKTYANDIKRQNGGKVYEYNVKAKDLLYPNTIEGFNELPSLNKRGAFQYNGKGLKPKK